MSEFLLLLVYWGSLFFSHSACSLLIHCSALTDLCFLFLFHLPTPSVCYVSVFDLFVLLKGSFRSLQVTQFPLLFFSFHTPSAHLPYIFLSCGEDVCVIRQGGLHYWLGVSLLAVVVSSQAFSWMSMRRLWMNWYWLLYLCWHAGPICFQLDPGHRFIHTVSLAQHVGVSALWDTFQPEYSVGVRYFPVRAKGLLVFFVSARFPMFCCHGFSCSRFLALSHPFSSAAPVFHFQPYYTSRGSLPPSSGPRGVPPSSTPRPVTPTHVYQAGPGSQMMMIPQQPISFSSSPQGPAYFIGQVMGRNFSFRQFEVNAMKRLIITLSVLIVSCLIPPLAFFFFFLVPLTNLCGHPPAIPGPSCNHRFLPRHQPCWIWYLW